MKTTDNPKSVRFLELSYQSQHPMRTLWGWSESSKLDLVWMNLVYIVKHAATWILPVVFAMLIDKLVNPEKVSAHQVWVGVGLLILFTLGNVPVHTYYVSLLSRIARRLEQKLRQALAIRLQQLSIPYHDDSESGRLQTKVLRDVEQVHLVLHHLGETGPSIFFTFLWVIGYTLHRKPEMLLVYLAMVPVILGLRHLFGNRIRQENKAFREKMEEMNATVSQMIEMIPVSRAHGIEGAATERVEQKFEQVRDQGRRLDRINAIFQSSSWAVFQTGNLIMFLITCFLCYLGRISVGEVVLFEQLFKQILFTCSQLMAIYPSLARGMESVRSIGEVLECPDLEKNHNKLEVHEVAGEIEYRNLGYTYANTDSPALADFNLRVAPGECVAVVGPSGGGKSTLMRLTIGFRRPTVGQILLDGHDMETLDMRTWRRFISVVPQESVLFEGTIRENILFGLQQVEPARFEEILQASNVREFVDKLPLGLDTRIGESGAKLSGGQRQRLAIARALVRDPQVIVLDEPTSALDVMSEKLVQEAIERLIEGRTTLIVAHRLSTIRNAHRIVVLENGRMSECGTFAELSARPGGAFARMQALQS